MAGKMLLVNPRRRARRKTTAKRRSPARRKTTARRRRANPVRRRRAAPKRTTRAVRRRTARAPVRRRRRSNPSRRGVMGKFVQPALMGGSTAVGIDVAMGYVPLPGILSTGFARHATKAAAAIGLGMFASNLGIVKRATAEEMGRGALTVYAADMIREGFAQFLPGVPLGYYSPAYVPPGQDGEVGEYLSGPTDPLDYSSGPGFDTMGEYMDTADEYGM